MHVYNSNKGQLGLHLPEKLLVDNFAGGGGASMGIEMAFGRPVDIAINHDPEAISMHTVNHPDTKHYCEDVWDVDPVKACNDKTVEFAWFSPDCKHFSKAKGGTPVEKNIRGLAWVAVKWCMSVDVEGFMLENVEEFLTWGPLNEQNKPCKDRKGQTFDGFYKALTTGLHPTHPSWNEAVEALGIEKDSASQIKLVKGLGYDVEYKIIRASALGVPTTRKRLYLKARKDGLPIYWAEQKYKPISSLEVQNGTALPERSAAECIDWSIPCKSIFNRPKPLAEKTLARIARGIKRFVLDSPNPFVMEVNGTLHEVQQADLRDDGNSLNETRSTLLTPYIVRIGQTGFGGNGMQYPLSKPLTTVTTKQEHCLVTPVIAPVEITDNSELCMSFLAQHYGGNYTGAGIDLNKPLGTITSVDHHALVTSHLVKLRGNETGQEVTHPMPTITAGGMHIGEVRAFLIKYYGTDTGQSLNDPLHTVTTNDRFGLVIIRGEAYRIVDIAMRMLEPHELYLAQGFPPYYIHDRNADGTKMTKKAQVRMCGNSVSPGVAEAEIKAYIKANQEREMAA